MIINVVVNVEVVNIVGLCKTYWFNRLGKRSCCESWDDFVCNIDFMEHVGDKFNGYVSFMTILAMVGGMRVV